MFYFYPYLGKIPFLSHMFQVGWNHQLEPKVLQVLEIAINKTNKFLS